MNTIASVNIHNKSMTRTVNLKLIYSYAITSVENILHVSYVNSQKILITSLIRMSVINTIFFSCKFLSNF